MGHVSLALNNLLSLLPTMQGGAIEFINGSILTVASCILSGNEASSGGAIFAQTCKNMVLYNSAFTNNNATSSGGAIFQVFVTKLCRLIICKSGFIAPHLSLGTKLRLTG